jgi:spore germination cell wall hydrolase CwlJ-like protein
VPIDISDDPVRVLAQTAYGEERSGGWNRMQGVCNVVMNRTKLPARFGEGVIGVCTKPMQFDCWNESDPNRAKIDAVTSADKLFQEATILAKLAIAGALPDMTKGADSYYDDTIEAPYWTKAEGAVETLVLGSTHFWRTVPPAEAPESAAAPAPEAAPTVIDAPIPIPVSTTEPTTKESTIEQPSPSKGAGP